MSRTPTISYGDSYSPGQVAALWDKPSSFVQRMIDDGKLRRDDRGLVTNTAMADFYATHAAELD